MEPITLIVVPGLAGGVIIAWLYVRFNRGRQHRISTDTGWRPPPSQDVINMARIRVAGVGGLGLLTMAAAVALFVPRIGMTLALGAALGGLFAALLIARRRRDGAMPSSGRRMGANTMLSIDSPRPAPDTQDDRPARLGTGFRHRLVRSEF